MLFSYIRVSSTLGTVLSRDLWKRFFFQIILKRCFKGHTCDLVAQSRMSLLSDFHQINWSSGKGKQCYWPGMEHPTWP